MSDFMNSPEGQAYKQQIVRAFHQWYYYTRMDGLPLYYNTYWMGCRAGKCPLDLWIYQEIFFEIRPQIIVEMGVAYGGSLVFYASMCSLLGVGEVVGVDIKLFDEAKRAASLSPLITLIEGSSVSPSIVEKIGKIIDGRKAVIILDSDHKKEHVLREMQIYNKFVPVGSYMIVEDSNLNGNPVWETYGPGPKEAIEEFMATNDEFEMDTSREKFMLTFNPNGYLRRVKKSGE